MVGFFFFANSSKYFSPYIHKPRHRDIAAPSVKKWSLFSCPWILIGLVTYFGQQDVEKWLGVSSNLKPQNTLYMFPHYLETLSLGSWRIKF